MGAWGTGLYSGDFASDLRIAVAAVARLPFDGERLLGLLRDTEPSAALDPKDPDHTAFWLVCADQFAKRGIVCSSVLEAALAIIDQDRDLATMSSLGMNETGLRARRRMLADLRQRLVASTPSLKPRTVLKEPQPYLLGTGDMILFPTTRGHCINPYFQSKEAVTGGWRQDGWGAALIVECGRAFDFLDWYRPLRAPEATAAKPDLAALFGLVTILNAPATGNLEPVALQKDGNRSAGVSFDLRRQAKPIVPEAARRRHRRH